MIRDLISRFDVAGCVGGKTRLRRKGAPLPRSHYWSRKRIIKNIRVAVGVICTSVVAAIFAHPWISRSDEELPPLLANDSFLMATFGEAETMALRDAYLKKKVLLNGLKSPDGLALDPLSGSIFFSEENIEHISRLDYDGRIECLIDEFTPVYIKHEGKMVPAAGLIAPEGLALDRHGTLYVVEDIPGGRLISFDLPEYHHGGPIFGVVVPIPEPAPGYAWESVAAGPQGELLLAGSNIEAFMANRQLVDVYSGAVMYRDAKGEWWTPLHRNLDSFSGASFDANAEHAYFISETAGYAGCLDLSSHTLRAWYADIKLDSPEGITCLPDGTAVVVCENGKLFRIDPQDNIASEVFDFNFMIESIAWDGANNRLIITADGSGELISLIDVAFSSTQKIQGSLYIEQTTHDVSMPDVCPDYLAGLIKLCRLDMQSSTNKDDTFQSLVRKVALFAVDAEANLAPGSDPIADPVERIQFSIFTPHFFGVDLSGLSGPASGFVAVNKSGAKNQTRMVQGSHMHHVNLFDGRFTAFTPKKMALPYPLSSRLTPDGIASVSFMGFGETPDYHIVLNMKNPPASYMVVMHPDGSHQHYALTLPAGKDAEHWVVGLKRETPQSWGRLQL